LRGSGILGGRSVVGSRVFVGRPKGLAGAAKPLKSYGNTLNTDASTHEYHQSLLAKKKSKLGIKLMSYMEQIDKKTAIINGQLDPPPPPPPHPTQPAAGGSSSISKRSTHIISSTTQVVVGYVADIPRLACFEEEKRARRGTHESGRSLGNASMWGCSPS
jgi:hypothetical protein